MKGKIGFSNHPMLEHFRFLKAHATVMPKMTIPSPSVFHFRLEPGAVSQDFYPSRDAIFEDLAAAYRTRCALSMRPAAATCNSTIPPGPICVPEVELKKARERGINVDHLQDATPT